MLLLNSVGVNIEGSRSKAGEDVRMNRSNNNTNITPGSPHHHHHAAPTVDIIINGPNASTSTADIVNISDDDLDAGDCTIHRSEDFEKTNEDMDNQELRDSGRTLVSSYHNRYQANRSRYKHHPALRSKNSQAEQWDWPGHVSRMHPKRGVKTHWTTETGYRR